MEAWLWPIVAWSGLVVVILFMMLCVNIIIRRQWIDHEKLSYPLTTLPVELLGNTSALFRNKLIWLGFGIAFGLEILAGLNYLFPVIPSLKIKYQLYFSDRPWNAVGRLPIYVYPFAIGFGYLMPLDLSLSLWFSIYLFGARSASFLAQRDGQPLSVYKPNNVAGHGSASGHSHLLQVGGRFGRYLAAYSPLNLKTVYTGLLFLD